MEVLDTERPPSAVERWVRPLLDRRGARPAIAAGVVLLLGVWVATSLGDESRVEARSEGAGVAVGAPGLRTPPEGARRSGTAPWQVRGDVVITRSPKGNTFTFVAVNGGTEPEDARDLQVEAGYLDRPEAVYAVACVGVERTPNGARARRALVDPGDRVLLRCKDPRRSGEPARVTPMVTTVAKKPCEDSADEPRA